MSRRALGLIVAVLVLVAATAATAAFANKSVTPKLGVYPSSVGGSELPFAQPTRLIVVKIGKRRGVEFEVSFPLTCPKAAANLPELIFAWVEKTPTPIKNGKFVFDRTVKSNAASPGGEPAVGPVSPGTTKLKVLGTFTSPTKAIVKESSTGSYEHFGECTGKQTATAKHM